MSFVFYGICFKAEGLETECVSVLMDIVGILCHEIYVTCIVNWMYAFNLVGLL